MDRIFEAVIWNVVAATGMAVAVVAAECVVRRPKVMHVLWMLVLVRLLMPPMLSFPAISNRPKPVISTSVIESMSKDTGNLNAGRSESSAGVRAGGENFAAMLEQAKVAYLTINRETPIGFRWSSVLIGIWIAGALTMLTLGIVRIAAFCSLLARHSTPVHRWNSMACELGKSLGLWRMPRVVVFDRRCSPLLWGFGRPTIVLPRALLERCDDDAVRTLLLHELVHFRRGDHWVRWLEWLATSLFWWLPTSWLAARRLRIHEERCCDETVADSAPQAVPDYVNALATTLDFVSQIRPISPRLASGLGPVGQLKWRVAMLEQHRQVHRGRVFDWTVAGLVGLGCLPIVPTIAGTADEPSSGAQKPSGKVAVPNNDRQLPEDAKPVLRADEQLRAVQADQKLKQDDARRYERQKKNGKAQDERAVKSAAFDLPGRIPREYLPEPTKIESDIAAMLRQPINLNFKNTSLRDIVEFLGDTTHINMALDERALQDANVDASKTMSIQAENIRVESALRRICRNLNLEYEIKDEALVLTSKEEAAQSFCTRIYPVGDLCTSADDLRQLQEAIRSTVVPETWNPAESPETSRPEGGIGGGGRGGGASGTASPRGLGGARGGELPSVNALNGERHGSSIVILELRDSLAIRQTYCVHREIVDFLRMLSQTKVKESTPASK